MLTLTSSDRRGLRARAHALAPVVMISAGGLTEALFAEIERGLAAHELIKIRAFSDERSEREAWMQAICERLGAAPVQHIGKILVAYRPRPAETGRAAAAKGPARRKGPRKTKKQILVER
jgi:RNA-binding protein